MSYLEHNPFPKTLNCEPISVFNTGLKNYQLTNLDITAGIAYNLEDYICKSLTIQNQSTDDIRIGFAEETSEIGLIIAKKGTIQIDCKNSNTVWIHTNAVTIDIRIATGD